MQTTGSVTEHSHIEILREIRQPILHALNRGFRSAFVHVVDQLVEQIVVETSWEHQDLLNASLDLLRTQKAGIEKHFESACSRSWQERTGVGADGQLSTPITTIMNDEPPTLRLVDDDTVRDQLLVSRIAARSRRRMEEELIDGLRARFGVLLGQDWFAENEYPIAPDIILELLRETLLEAQAEANGRITGLLLDLFEPKLSIELNELYQEVNRRLIGYRVLPELRYSIAKSRNSTPPSPAADDSGSRGNAGQGKAIQGRSSAQAGQQGWLPSDHDLGRWAEQVHGGQHPQALASATRYLADPKNFGKQGQVRPPATSGRLLDELSSLQLSDEGDSPEDVHQLAAKARQQSAAAARQHGSPLERLIIETVAQVFQHVYEDDAIANAVKQQLLRLQVAAFKAALIDPGFFARPDHPMRRFVDRLAEIGSDPDFETEPGSPLLHDLEALVTWVLHNFERELVIIAEALDRTEAIIAEETARRDERLALFAEAASKAERTDALRQEVRQNLAARISSPELPASIRDFIMNAWAEVIVRLRDDSDELPFDESRAERVVETLVWSVLPKKATEIRDLAKQLPQLIADLSRGLAFIAMPAGEREAFLRQLMHCHGQVIEQSKRRCLETGDCQPGNKRAAPLAEPAASSTEAKGQGASILPNPALAQAPAWPDPAWSGQPAGKAPEPGLKVPPSNTAAAADMPAAGDSEDWDAVSRSGLQHSDEVEKIEADGESKRYKLGWISPAGSIFIFSRYPREHWTVNRAQLNQMLAEGQVRICPSLSRVSTVIVALSQQDDDSPAS